MPGHDDDLAPWNDEPLVRALRGPGTADELGGESDYVSAFRAAQPVAPTTLPSGHDRLRRVARRLGGGGTAVVVAVALGAGAAAAAYTRSLPEPVQRAVHDVLGPVGVPGPETPPRDPGPGPERSPAPTRGAPSATGAPSSSPSDAPTDKPSDEPTDQPPDEPTTEPTDTPTSGPTDDPGVAAAASVQLSGTTHRAAPDEQVSLSGIVTAADATPVAGEQVALLQRSGRTWLPVASAASDGSGAVRLSAPVLARTAVFRLAVGDDLTSEPWRIVVVPSLDMVARPEGSATGIVVTARGGRPGDRVTLHSRRPAGDVLVARARLSGDLTAIFPVSPPRERVTFVARLPRSRAHASALDTLQVRPLKPRAMTATVPVDTLGPRDSVTVTGAVSGLDGILLPGRRVVLMLREPGGEWRRVGSAVSDSTGGVRIPVGPIDRSVAVRLRAGKVRSPSVQLRLQPEWSASVSSAGAGAAVIGTAIGGAPGDVVLLRTAVAGQLTTVQQSTLGPGGAVRFEVPLPERRQDRYRLVLARTPTHLRATTTAVVRAPSQSVRTTSGQRPAAHRDLPGVHRVHHGAGQRSAVPRIVA